MDPRDEKIANLEAQLAEAQKRERDVMLRAKAEEDNLRRRTEQDIEKAHKFALEKFVNELLPVIDSLDRALEVADKANPDMAPMVEGIELTLKSMLGVVRTFGVEVVADTNVPLDPNVHQAIAMVESDDVAELPSGRIAVNRSDFSSNVFRYSSDKFLYDSPKLVGIQFKVCKFIGHAFYASRYATADR